MRLVNMDDIRWCDQFDHDGNLKPYKIAYSDEMPPEVDAIPLDWIMGWYQRRVSGRKNYKSATTMVIRELLDAWDAESGGNAGTKGYPCSNCQEFDCYGCEFERDGNSNE